MCRKALALVKSSHNLNKVIVVISQQSFICKQCFMWIARKRHLQNTRKSVIPLQIAFLFSFKQTLETHTWKTCTHACALESRQRFVINLTEQEQFRILNQASKRRMSYKFNFLVRHTHNFPDLYIAFFLECPLKCQNGGTLNEQDCVCSCASGWRGMDCSGRPQESVTWSRTVL